VQSWRTVQIEKNSEHKAPPHNPP